MCRLCPVRPDGIASASGNASSTGRLSEHSRACEAPQLRYRDLPILVVTCAHTCWGRGSSWLVQEL